MHNNNINNNKIFSAWLGQPPFSWVLLFQALEHNTGPSSLQVWNQGIYYMAGVPSCGLVEVRSSTYGEEKPPHECYYEEKVKMDEIKFDCTMSSNFHVIDLMKLRFPQKFRTSLGKCMLRGIRQVCWSPL